MLDMLNNSKKTSFKIDTEMENAKKKNFLVNFNIQIWPQIRNNLSSLDLDKRSFLPVELSDFVCEKNRKKE